MCAKCTQRSKEIQDLVALMKQHNEKCSFSGGSCVEDDEWNMSEHAGSSGESILNVQDSEDYPPSRSSFSIVLELSANDSVSVTSWEKENFKYFSQIRTFRRYFSAVDLGGGDVDMGKAEEAGATARSGCEAPGMGLAAGTPHAGPAAEPLGAGSGATGAPAAGQDPEPAARTPHAGPAAEQDPQLSRTWGQWPSGTQGCQGSPWAAARPAAGTPCSRDTGLAAGTPGAKPGGAAAPPKPLLPAPTVVSGLMEGKPPFAHRDGQDSQ
ncbi:hypothetical protein UY3_10137 [Chelonia mydas]|uniref:Uncharacterized protein n=1 Tax=Chelonia mydas TaxID=8469 RepID=M7BL20_CHEMY|nr:hypothetical protein UY3_10137 [Chelonia mydas]